MPLWIWPALLVLLAALIILSRLLVPVSGKMQRQDLGPLPEPSEEVRKLAQEGKKIEAIKRYREETGLGLMESKTAVDRLG